MFVISCAIVGVDPPAGNDEPASVPRRTNINGKPDPPEPSPFPKSPEPTSPLPTDPPEPSAPPNPPKPSASPDRGNPNAEAGGDFFSNTQDDGAANVTEDDDSLDLEDVDMDIHEDMGYQAGGPHFSSKRSGKAKQPPKKKGFSKSSKAAGGKAYQKKKNATPKQGQASTTDDATAESNKNSVRFRGGLDGETQRKYRKGEATN